MTVPLCIYTSKAYIYTHRIILFVPHIRRIVLFCFVVFKLDSTRHKTCRRSAFSLATKHQLDL